MLLRPFLFFWSGRGALVECFAVSAAERAEAACTFDKGVRTSEKAFDAISKGLDDTLDGYRWGMAVVDGLGNIDVAFPRCRSGGDWGWVAGEEAVRAGAHSL